MKLENLKGYLDELLSIRTIQDESLNGLQVQNSGSVKCLGFAVDASIEVFSKAHDMGVDVLLVHHGLFWGKPLSMTGNLFQRIRLLMDYDMALYAVHLPLDLHPKFGNNAGIAKALQWPVRGSFGVYHGETIGKYAILSKEMTMNEVKEIVRSRLNCNPVIWNFGNHKVKKVAIVSGNGISMIEDAIKIGADTMITGEPSHSHYWIAKESRINVIFAGHYATETIGVTALAKHLTNKFHIKSAFIDKPTQL